MTGKKPKLLYVLHCYYNRAGTEKHTQELAKKLANKYEISILYPEGNSLGLIQNGEKVSSFPADPCPFPVTPYRLPKTEQSVKQVIQQLSPDLIHIQHFIYWPLAILDQLLSFGKPLILSFHDYYAVTPHFTMQELENAEETLLPGYSEKIFGQDISKYLEQRREVMKNSIAKIPLCIVPSSYLAGQLNQLFPREYRVVEHGIEPFQASERQVPVDLGELVFGYIGSLLPQKGWHSLLNAFVEVRKHFPKSSLRFYGGEAPPELAALEGISFHGVYEQEQLAQINSEFDIGIIPSIFAETYCFTLSELWMGKKPVIASDIGALGQRIKQEVNGKKFKAGNIQSIVDTISWMLSNNEWKNWEIPNPKKLDNMIAEYDEIYQSYLGK